MTSENNQELRVQQILWEALKLSGDARIAYLEMACGGDSELRREVESLLEAEGQAGTFLFPKPQESVFAVPLAEKAGDRIGHYKLLEKIGEGGFGVVWMAEQQEPVRRRVALKIIKLGMDTREVVARFEAERQALAMMEHPNIARVFDGGATETGRPYFVMELVKGVPITEYCDLNKLTTKQRLELFMPICEAVQHAHAKGVIHRDLKPSNVLVTVLDDRPVPKVIDFGVAKATQARLTEKTLFTRFQQWVGTPAYMSPEQAGLGSLEVDARTDVYALGALLYELLIGKTPFDTKKLLEAGLEAVLRTIREEEPPKPSTRLSTLGSDELKQVALQRQANSSKLGTMIQGELDWMVMKALEKDRQRRYQSAKELGLDLQRYLENKPVMAAAPSKWYRVQKFALRHKLGLGLAVGFVAGYLLLNAVVGIIFTALRSPPPGMTLNARFHNVGGLAPLDPVLLQGNKVGCVERIAFDPARGSTLVSLRIFKEYGDQIHMDSRASIQWQTELRNGGYRVGFHVVVQLGTPSAPRAAEGMMLAVDETNFPGPSSNKAAKETALTESRRADAAATEANSALSASDFLQGVRLIAENNGNDALAFLTRSLLTNPTNNAALTRLASLLTYHSWIMPTLTMKSDFPMVLAQFSPDGKRVVTASQDKTARVWDAETGQSLTEPMTHDGTVVSAQFSPDGKRIVTASYDKTARVWDAQTGEPLTEPLKHGGWVNSAQFSPDGKRIVTASQNYTARMWDAETGQPLTKPMTHDDAVVSAQFSPDGKQIVTASWDNTARIWDAQTGQPLTKPMTHGLRGGFRVVSAQFSSDGKRIVTACVDTAHVWDAQTGRPLTEPMKHDSWVNSAQFSPDGKRIVTASRDKTARVWDAQTGRPLTEPMKHGHWVCSAQFSPDGQRIVTASDDKTACVWDAQTGQPLAEPVKHGSGVSSAQFSSNGKQILTVSRDNAAYVWDAQSSRALAESFKHGGVVWSAQFSPDGKRIATASSDKTARVWDAQTGRLLTASMAHGDIVWSARFSPDGKRIVTASEDTTAHMWDAQTGQSLTEPLNHAGAVVSAQFSPDGKQIVTASWDKTARVWDAQTGQPLTVPMTHGDKVISAQFSPDGKQIVTASWDATARVWDAQTGQPLMQPLHHDNKVCSGQFSPNGKRIVTASCDKTARVWDAQTGQPLTEPLNHASAVLSAQFSLDGKRIITASDNTARVWDAQNGQPLTEPLKHDSALVAAQFSVDGKRIVTASWDKTARVWDAQTGEPQTEPMTHANWVNSAQFSPDGKRIATASSDNAARVWDVAPTPTRLPDWLLVLDEAISGQVLNKKGILEPTRLNRAEVLNQIRQRLAKEPDDDWVIWGRWFLADRATRTISPFSRLTAPQYIENRIEEMTPQSLDEAERLAVGNPALLQRILQSRRAPKP